MTRAIAPVVVLLSTVLLTAQDPAAPTPPPEPAISESVRLVELAQHAFYNARYLEAAAATATPCTEDDEALAACELRTAALLFQLKRALGHGADKGVALKACDACPALMTEFQRTFDRGRTLARARLKSAPTDDDTQFFLGKLNLNYVWLHLGTLGRKTGWGEYWEARKTLDALLKRRPDHVRARVARGWIDYIVDTRMPRGTKWLLGGGNRKKGLLAVREAAETDGEFYTRAEARFALWDMQVREKNIPDAVLTARTLASDFPENEELVKFLEAHER